VNLNNVKRQKKNRFSKLIHQIVCDHLP
jgi:hypothetical protein